MSHLAYAVVSQPHTVHIFDWSNLPAPTPGSRGLATRLQSAVLPSATMHVNGDGEDVNKACGTSKRVGTPVRREPMVSPGP